ncbi:hypothetical protein BGLA2_920008 [Burkholderia gladioli]|nr:hypothetical protein BGLA2_920008 [Burkholderia gladioli]
MRWSAASGSAPELLRSFSFRLLLYASRGARDDPFQSTAPCRPFVRCRAGITARVPGSSPLNPQSLRPHACGAAGNRSDTRVPEPSLPRTMDTSRRS